MAERPAPDDLFDDADLDDLDIEDLDVDDIDADLDEAAPNPAAPTAAPAAGPVRPAIEPEAPSRPAPATVFVPRSQQAPASPAQDVRESTPPAPRRPGPAPRSVAFEQQLASVLGGSRRRPRPALPTATETPAVPAEALAQTTAPEPAPEGHPTDPAGAPQPVAEVPSAQTPGALPPDRTPPGSPVPSHPLEPPAPAVPVSPPAPTSTPPADTGTEDLDLSGVDEIQREIRYVELPTGVTSRNTPIAEARRRRRRDIRAIEYDTSLTSSRQLDGARPVRVPSAAMPMRLENLAKLQLLQSRGDNGKNEERLQAHEVELDRMLAAPPADAKLLAAITSPKGGTGKSTLALAVGDALAAARPDMRVLIVDLDVDGSGEMPQRAPYGTSAPTTGRRVGLNDLMSAMLDEDALSVDPDTFCHHMPRGCRLLAGAGDRQSREELLANPEALEFLMPLLQGTYDFILMDLGAGTANHLSQTVRRLVDTVLYVTDWEPTVVTRSGATLRELLADAGSWTKPTDIGIDEPTRLVPIVNKVWGRLLEYGDGTVNIYDSYQSIFQRLGNFVPLGVPRDEELELAMAMVDYELHQMPTIVRMELKRVAIHAWPPVTEDQ